MKAIRVHQFGGPEVLRLQDVPEPRAGAGQVVVRLKTIGVNPVETYLRSGSNPALALPYTPGTDGAGTVESTGSGVSRFKPGDRVYTHGSVSGTYAEAALCEERQVCRLPERITFEQGASLGIPYATAFRGLFQRGGAVAGEILLVHGGSGGVGVAAIQLARAAGLTVIATAGTEAGRKLVVAEGAHYALDHRAEGYLEEVSKISAGHGADLILEMLANVNLGKDLPLLAKEGRVVVIGSRGKVEITPRDLMSRDADIRAMTLFNATPEMLKGIHAALYAGLENGTLRPIVGKLMGLAEAARAHVEIMQPGAHGKIILKPQP